MKRLILFLLFLCGILENPFDRHVVAESLERALVIAPHPDDEVICCSSVLRQFTKTSENISSLRIVVLTAEPYDQKPGKSEDVSLATLRENESRSAVASFGLPPEVLSFYNYPDGSLENQLSFSHKSDEGSHKFDDGKPNGSAIFRLASLLREFKPEVIYFPHYADKHRDHRAAYWIVRNALLQVQQVPPLPRLLAYIVHQPSGKIPEDAEKVLVNLTTNDTKKKKIALEKYVSQSKFLAQLGILPQPNEATEIFYELAADRNAFLSRHRDTWLTTSQLLNSLGYNVNLGVVADLRGSAPGGSNFNLSSRTFSSDPKTIIDLIQPIVEASGQAGVIPVIKHFPGLGKAKVDTHRRLSRITVSKEELFSNDLVPFAELINSESSHPDRSHFWIMPGHAIYTALDNLPASISPVVLGDILRKQLGFKGIVISDELSAMQSLREFALENKLGEESNLAPVLVYKAFKAGTDLAVVYLHPADAKKKLNSIISYVESKVTEGDLTEEFLDQSVQRIIEEKQRLYGASITQKFENISLRNKILQKIVVDDSTQINQLPGFEFGGIHFRNSFSKDQILKDFTIPPFFIAQHEGGEVQERQLKELKNVRVIRESAQTTGQKYRAFQNETGLKQIGDEEPYPYSSEPKANQSAKELSSNFPSNFQARVSKYSDEKKLRILHAARVALKYPQWFKTWGSQVRPGRVSPSLFGPIAIGPDSDLYLRSRTSLPYEWVRTFDSEEDLDDAYNLITLGYEKWASENGKEKNVSLPSGFEVWGERATSGLEAVETSVCNIARDLNFPHGRPRILILSAHPDDEDSQAAIFFTEKYQADVFAVYATRGEGGKNFFDNRFDKALGMLRIEETSRALDLLGTKGPYLLSAPDFGYTRSLGDVWQIWDRKRLSDELAYLLRIIRPHLVITKHTLADSHAQHRATIEILQDSLNIVADRGPQATDLKTALELNQITREKSDPNLSPPSALIRTYNSSDSIKLTIDLCSEFETESERINDKVKRSLAQHQSQGIVGLPRKGAKSSDDKTRQGDSPADKKPTNNCPIRYALLASPAQLQPNAPTNTEGAASLTANTLYPLIDLKNISICDEPISFIQPTKLPGILVHVRGRLGLISSDRASTNIALDLLTYPYQRMEEDSLKNGILNNIQILLVDRLAFSHLPWLGEYKEQLLEFVRRGGHLVVMTQAQMGRTEVQDLSLGLRSNFKMRKELASSRFSNYSPSPILERPTQIDLATLLSGLGAVGDEVVTAKEPGRWTGVLQFLPQSSPQDSEHKSIEGEWFVAELLLGAGTIHYVSIDLEQAFQSLNIEAYRLLSNILSN